MKFTSNLENPFFSISEIFLVIFVATIRTLQITFNSGHILEYILIPLSLIVLVSLILFEKRNSKK